MLSRFLLDMTTFMQSENGSKIGTDYNWNCIMGKETARNTTLGMLHSSHEALMYAQRANILYYQSMICNFVTAKGHQQKAHVIVFCQRADVKDRNRSELFEQAVQNFFSLDTLYYLFFVLMLFLTVFGGRFCAALDDNGKLILSEERKIKMSTGQDALSIYEQYCENQRDVSMVSGSAFIVFAVTRAFFNKAARKTKQA